MRFCPFKSTLDEKVECTSNCALNVDNRCALRNFEALICNDSLEPISLKDRTCPFRSSAVCAFDCALYSADNRCSLRGIGYANLKTK